IVQDIVWSGGKYGFKFNFKSSQHYMCSNNYIYSGCRTCKRKEPYVMVLFLYFKFKIKEQFYLRRV
uniref:hypothetical protein n=1 Tax=Clostridium perfringens TaxID=1502 RepID=UPI0039E7A0AF